MPKLVKVTKGSFIFGDRESGKQFLARVDGFWLARDPATTDPQAERKIYFECEVLATRTKYSGTDHEKDLPQYAVFGCKFPAGSFPVDYVDPKTELKLKLNARGLRGMSGGIWEETSTIWSDNPQTPPTEATIFSNWVLRGGSWFADSWTCRVSNRRRLSYWNEFQDVGLRLAADFPPDF